MGCTIARAPVEVRVEDSRVIRYKLSSFRVWRIEPVGHRKNRCLKHEAFGKVYHISWRRRPDPELGGAAPGGDLLCGLGQVKELDPQIIPCVRLRG